MGKIFNLKKERPKVLLVGNGLLRSKGNPSWDELIVELSSDTKEDIKLSESVPYSIKASVVSDFNDIDRHNKYYNKFSSGNYKYSNNHLLNELLKIPFDAILTTNYTYEIEYGMDNQYPFYNDVKKRSFSYIKGKGKGKEKKYSVYRYNSIPFAINNEIWHIHGEQRRKSSIVLTHDEYIRLIFNIVDYSNSVKNDYEKNIERFVFNSWIDYFILGDLYILGQGVYFSELDLWWLINRRKREKINYDGSPQIIMYNPLELGNLTEECSVLRKLGARIESFNLSVPPDDSLKNDFYKSFYKNAIKDISKYI